MAHRIQAHVQDWFPFVLATETRRLGGNSHGRGQSQGQGEYKCASVVPPSSVTTASKLFFHDARKRVKELDFGNLLNIKLEKLTSRELAARLTDQAEIQTNQDQTELNNKPGESLCITVEVVHLILTMRRGSVQELTSLPTNEASKAFISIYSVLKVRDDKFSKVKPIGMLLLMIDTKREMKICGTTSIREWINHTPMIVTESLQLHVQSSHHHKPKEARPYIYGLLKSLLKQSLKLHVLQAKDPDEDEEVYCIHNAKPSILSLPSHKTATPVSLIPMQTQPMDGDMDDPIPIPWVSEDEKTASTKPEFIPVNRNSAEAPCSSCSSSMPPSNSGDEVHVPDQRGLGWRASCGFSRRRSPRHGMPTVGGVVLQLVAPRRATAAAAEVRGAGEDGEAAVVGEEPEGAGSGWVEQAAEPRRKAGRRGSPRAAGEDRADERAWRDGRARRMSSLREAYGGGGAGAGAGVRFGSTEAAPPIARIGMDCGGVSA
uniref:Uncharacterized protein n=1 Tax=Oryza nivara TaxID=4536 RepID=A0A0E0G427_ORYNI